MRLDVLTLWAEWAAGIAYLGKLTENRGWWPPRSLVGRRFAIHAGAHIGGRPGWPAHDIGLAGLRETALDAGWVLAGWSAFRDPRYELTFFHEPDIGRAYDLAGDIDDDTDDEEVLRGAYLWHNWREHDHWRVPIHRSAIVCTAVLLGADTEQRTPWDVPGAVHWRLGDVVRLREPVSCRGAQGLWTVPEDVAAAVRAQGGCP